ncbi:MAG: sulfite exporter TauE/SafE family protein [Ignavibacteriales bacterium]|nr:sulfite exporter TauE/SafE family protein [Ignavibacteriales bacterium]
MENIGIFAAFTAGLISFISPCVLPIVPGYLSFISGISFDEMQSGDNRGKIRKRILLNVLFFIIGFSIVFIALGASATAIGQFLQEQMKIISKIAGIIIIIFGIHMVGIYKIPFLNYEKRFHTSGKSMGMISAMVIGFAFAFGWTPCIGPFLATILLYASRQETIGQGIILLSAYSLGLGIPFFLAGLSVSFFLDIFNKFKKHLHKVEIVGGILLILFGVLIMTNYLTILSGYFAKWFPFLNELG